MTLTDALAAALRATEELSTADAAAAILADPAFREALTEALARAMHAGHEELAVHPHNLGRGAGDFDWWLAEDLVARLLPEDTP